MMMMKKAGSLTAMLALAGMADALDMKFSKISCDTSLPAFAYDDDIKVQCEYEEATGEKRSDPSTCSLGDSAVVSGLCKFAIVRCDMERIPREFPQFYSQD